MDYRRYGMHDLICRYAQDHAATELAADRGRALDYYQYTAAIAEDVLARQTRSKPAATAIASPPALVPDLTGGTRTWAWAWAERTNLIACLDHATRTGQHARFVALTAAITALLRNDGPWTAAITRHTTAVHAAQHLGDRLGEAGALNNLGAVRRLTGDYPGAAEALEEALAISRDIGDRLGQGNALNELGVVRRLTGDNSGAAEALEEALGIYRDIGNRLGEAEALNEVGTQHWVRGDLGRAAACHQQALDLAREIDSSRDEANALAGLGRRALASGRTAEKASLRPGYLPADRRGRGRRSSR